MSHRGWRTHALGVVGTMLAGLLLVAYSGLTPTESAAAIPAQSTATALPTGGAPTVTPQVAVLEAPAEVRRVFDIVWAGEGDPDSTTLTQLGTNEWRALPAGGQVTADENGEGWVKFSDCMKIYIFQDSRLVKAACPKSDYAGGNVTCSQAGTAVYNNQCASQIIIQTPSAQIRLEGTWLSVTYLPDRQMTVVMVFEGQAKVQPVVDADAYTLGEAINVPAGYFLLTTPGLAPEDIGGLASREAHSLNNLLPVVEELDLWRWMDRITLWADIDDIPYPASPPFAYQPIPPIAHSAPRPAQAGACEHYFAGARPILEWSYDQPLAQDEYFRVDIAFWHHPETWHDVHWVKEPRLQVPDYMYRLLQGNRDFTWTVAIARKTGVNSEGLPTGDIISEQSAPVLCFWYSDGTEEELAQDSAGGEPIHSSADDNSRDEPVPSWNWIKHHPECWEKYSDIYPFVSIPETDKECVFP